jgi:biopolymer transport protein ExbD
VSKDGKYAVNGNVVEVTNLQAKMESLKNQVAQVNEANANALRIVVSADAKASHQSVMQVLEFASLAGLNNIVFATQDSQPNLKKK